MDRLDAMRAFAAVADEQGFAPAARRLRLSPPAVTRAVAALEERLGARLLHRTTRVVRLTEAGIRFLNRKRQKKLLRTASNAYRKLDKAKPFRSSDLAPNAEPED